MVICRVMIKCGDWVNNLDLSLSLDSENKHQHHKRFHQKEKQTKIKASDCKFYCYKLLHSNCMTVLSFIYKKTLHFHISVQNFSPIMYFKMSNAKVFVQSVNRKQSRWGRTNWNELKLWRCQRATQNQTKPLNPLWTETGNQTDSSCRDVTATKQQQNKTHWKRKSKN